MARGTILRLMRPAAPPPALAHRTHCRRMHRESHRGRLSRLQWGGEDPGVSVRGATRLAHFMVPTSRRHRVRALCLLVVRMHSPLSRCLHSCWPRRAQWIRARPCRVVRTLRECPLASRRYACGTPWATFGYHEYCAVAFRFACICTQPPPCCVARASLVRRSRIVRRVSLVHCFRKTCRC